MGEPSAESDSDITASDAEASSSEQTAERDLFGRTPKGRRDWSHRRGEPRLFAALWMVYLLAVSGQLVFALTPIRSHSPGVIRSAAELMLLTSLAGVVVVWPAVRLSQAAPRRSGVFEAARDLLIVATPALALVVPQGLPFMASWSVEVVLAVCAHFLAWSLVTGGLVAIALEGLRRPGGHTGAWRAGWAALFVVIFVLPPIVAPARLPWAMLGPVTGLQEIVRDRAWTGSVARVSGEHWRALIALAGFAGAGWLVAIGLAPGGRDV